MQTKYSIIVAKTDDRKGYERLPDNVIATNGMDAPDRGGGIINQKAQPGMVNALLMDVGSKAISYGVSNYGNLTGDYLVQSNIQGAIDLGRTIGMALTGVPGLIAAVGGLAIKEASRQLEIYKKNQNVSLLRERTGMNQISGGRL